MVYLPHAMIFVQCQHLNPEQKVLCPIYTSADSILICNVIYLPWPQYLSLSLYCGCHVQILTKNMRNTGRGRRKKLNSRPPQSMDFYLRKISTGPSPSIKDHHEHFLQYTGQANFWLGIHWSLNLKKQKNKKHSSCSGNSYIFLLNHISFQIMFGWKPQHPWFTSSWRRLFNISFAISLSPHFRSSLCSYASNKAIKTYKSHYVYLQKFIFHLIVIISCLRSLIAWSGQALSILSQWMFSTLKSCIENWGHLSVANSQMQHIPYYDLLGRYHACLLCVCRPVCMSGWNSLALCGV